MSRVKGTLTVKNQTEEKHASCWVFSPAHSLSIIAFVKTSSLRMLWGAIRLNKMTRYLILASLLNLHFGWPILSQSVSGMIYNLFCHDAVAYTFGENKVIRRFHDKGKNNLFDHFDYCRLISRLIYRSTWYANQVDLERWKFNDCLVMSASAIAFSGFRPTFGHAVSELND